MTQSLATAAQYLRMSTVHQQYSLDDQADAISRYVADHGFVIVKDPLRCREKWRDEIPATGAEIAAGCLSND